MKTQPLALAVLLMLWMMVHQSPVLGGNRFSGGEERTLNGHSFMHSQYIADPFVGSAFTNHVGAAQAVSITRDFHDLNGDYLFSLSGSVVFAALGMKYQQHLGEKWAVGAGGSALVRSGTNALSFIDDGANVTSNSEVWVKRLLQRGESSQLTAGLSWKYSSITMFTPRAFAEHILAGDSLVDAPLVFTGKLWSLQADLMWAHAFNPTFGFRTTGSFGVVEDFAHSDILLGTNRISVLGEVDFKSRYQIPVGLTLGTFYGFPPDRSGSGLKGLLLGFWYTGRDEFVIGVESGWLKIPTDDDGDNIDGVFGVFNIKYYF